VTRILLSFRGKALLPEGRQAMLRLLLTVPRVESFALRKNYLWFEVRDPGDSLVQETVSRLWAWISTSPDEERDA